VDSCIISFSIYLPLPSISYLDALFNLRRARLSFPLHFSKPAISLLPKTYISAKYSSQNYGGSANGKYFFFSSSVISILLYSIKTTKGLSVVKNAVKFNVLHKLIGASSEYPYLFLLFCIILSILYTSFFN